MLLIAALSLAVSALVAARLNESFGREGAERSLCSCALPAMLAMLAPRRRIRRAWQSTMVRSLLGALQVAVLSSCTYEVGVDAAPLDLDEVFEADQASVAALTPASLHFIYQSSPQHWNSIVALAETQPNMVFVGVQKPPQIAAHQWAAYVSYRSTPPPTADDIAALLTSADPPRLVMIEELHNRASETFIAALASDMEARFPEWRGRWGAFVSFGHYARLSTGIDALLRADGVIALELYPRQSEYCASGVNGGQRDAWLARQFNGDATLARLDWLMARRELRGSGSVITPLFGVGDVLLDGAQPAKFLDRMFYVWATRVGYPELIDAERGGPGTYKWQDIHETPLGYGVSNTSRDLAFTQSFQHYSVDRRVTSLKGPVPCD